ncbi:hypothetical protein QP027_04735 [Corynebacterium breve]|uniref:Uncharacterized protein n=1 Tax=Corynebacterium breve TaxID=3049799 RepID=A0ABY8VH86_9CORY|nr:hypothetical protein [Corynebacterium breve]WIM68697.1 hypothetical protein QP027_04735 [Corynebacterium breve]
MKQSAKITLTVLAWFQAISTVIGWVTLWFVPHIYDSTLDPTPFAGQQILAGFLLGVIVGGPQWAAIIIERVKPQWRALAHLVAGFVMMCWVFGECLVLNSFNWAHALWGGIGLLQLVFVAIFLGALEPTYSRPAANP